MFRPADTNFSERRAALRWSLKDTAEAPSASRCLRVHRPFTKEDDEEEIIIREAHLGCRGVKKPNAHKKLCQAKIIL